MRKQRRRQERTGLEAVQRAVHGDRELRIQAFDALDTKSGIVGGAALLLAGLSLTALPQIAVLVVFPAARSAWLSYRVLRLRGVSYLEPETIRKLATRSEFAALTEILAQETEWSKNLRDSNNEKADRYKRAEWWLGITGALFLAAILVRAATELVDAIGGWNVLVEFLRELIRTAGG